jgi:hypothetical protein
VIGEHGPQVLKCIGFVAALTRSDGMGWIALQVEQRDVRREARLQGQNPLQLEAFLVELRRLGQLPKPRAEIVQAVRVRQNGAATRAISVPAAAAPAAGLRLDSW